jgi:S-adenosyl-L-methionine hydrolase (adenosine-forming)
MIVLFTDFGLEGPYTGQMKAVLQQEAPGVPIVDLFADAPVGNPKASAYLLAAYAGWFPATTIFLCVVDPGVGGTRPTITLAADNRWYVGPGNGLSSWFSDGPTRRAAGTSSGSRAVYRPAFMDATSSHQSQPCCAGPAAAGPAVRERRPDWPDDLCEIVYLDHFRQCHDWGEGHDNASRR